MDDADDSRIWQTLVDQTIKCLSDGSSSAEPSSSRNRHCDWRAGCGRKANVLLLAARQRLAQSLDHIERIYEPTKLDITRHPPQLGIVKHSALIRYSTLPEACQSTGTGTAAQTAHARLARVRHTRV